MKTAWVVKLTKKPVVDDFSAGYFPRKFFYKTDAIRLVAEVRRKGGEAVIEKAAGAGSRGFIYGY